MVNITTLEHFDGGKIPDAHKQECVDILIGQSDKLTVLEEREQRFIPCKLCVHSSWTCCKRGRVPQGSDGFPSPKVYIEHANAESEFDIMKTNSELLNLNRNCLNMSCHTELFNLQGKRNLQLVLLNLILPLSMVI